MTPEQQLATKREIFKGHPEYFTAHYLKNELPLNIPQFHLEIYKDLADWSLKRLAIKAPTGFGKSCVTIFAFPLYVICFRICEYILLICNTASFAIEKLRDIATAIDCNELIRRDFGIDRGAFWQQDDLITNNGVRVKAVGAGSQITGRRPNLIIGDDIQTELQAKSEIERASLAYWWDATVVNRMTPDDRIVLIGSTVSPLAFLNRFEKEPNNKVWTVRKYGTKNCKTIWAEKWSDYDLERRKLELASAPGLYEALYESDTSQISKYAFRTSWLREYEQLPQGLSIFTVVDPAIGERLTNDYTAILTGGIDIYGNLFIIDLIKKRFNLETLELFGALFTIYEIHRPVKIGFETIAFQKFVKIAFQQECNKRGKYPNIVEIKHDTRITKAMRITSLAPLAQGGQLFIKKNMYDFISEWEAYPEVEHDDVLDATSMLKDLATLNSVGSNTGEAPKPEPWTGHDKTSLIKDPFNF